MTRGRASARLRMSEGTQSSGPIKKSGENWGGRGDPTAALSSSWAAAAGAHAELLWCEQSVRGRSALLCSACRLLGLRQEPGNTPAHSKASVGTPTRAPRVLSAVPQHQQRDGTGQGRSRGDPNTGRAGEEELPTAPRPAPAPRTPQRWLATPLRATRRGSSKGFLLAARSYLDLSKQAAATSAAAGRQLSSSSGSRVPEPATPSAARPE